MRTPKINRYPIVIDGETAFIGTANELSIALDVLQGQYDRQALVQLQPHLAEIISHANGLITVLRSLSVEDRIFLIQALGPSLVDVVQSAVRLRDILAIVSDQDVEEKLLITLSTGGLRRLIMTGEELAEVLEWVYGEQDALMLELLGDDYVRQLCRHATDLSAILRNIDFSLQAKLLDALGWPFIVNLVKDGYDLASLMRALPPELSAKLLDHFSAERLLDLIGNADEWTYLYQRLEPAEADLMLSRFNNK
ncbi:MAG: hypothetical protein P4L50_14985 [Anaerolineaceae bacterium]|nr:hypothetical protein [Anaerolineaceae bacterium]